MVAHPSRSRSVSRSRSPHPRAGFWRWVNASPALQVMPRGCISGPHTWSFKGISSLGLQLRQRHFDSPESGLSSFLVMIASCRVQQTVFSISELWIFTDGSSIWDAEAGQVAGCVAVGMGADPWQYSICALLAGPVTCDQSSAVCKGAAQATSGVAELEAMIWAALWCLQWSARPRVCGVGLCRRNLSRSW